MVNTFFLRVRTSKTNTPSKPEPLTSVPHNFVETPGGGGGSRTWGQLCDHPRPHPQRLLTYGKRKLSSESERPRRGHSRRHLLTRDWSFSTHVFLKALSWVRQTDNAAQGLLGNSDPVSGAPGQRPEPLQRKYPGGASDIFSISPPGRRGHF